MQAAYERVLRHWPRLATAGEPAAYANRILVNLTVDGGRSRSRRPEVLTQPPEQAVGDCAEVVGERTRVLDALRQLPRQQRAVVVLRYYSDLSEADIAAALGCSVGTVPRRAPQRPRRAGACRAPWPVRCSTASASCRVTGATSPSTGGASRSRPPSRVTARCQRVAVVASRWGRVTVTGQGGRPVDGFADQVAWATVFRVRDDDQSCPGAPSTGTSTAPPGDFAETQVLVVRADGEQVLYSQPGSWSCGLPVQPVAKIPEAAG